MKYFEDKPEDHIANMLMREWDFLCQESGTHSWEGVEDSMALKAAKRIIELEAKLAKVTVRKLTMAERYDVAMERLVKHHELPTGQDS